MYPKSFLTGLIITIVAYILSIFIGDVLIPPFPLNAILLGIYLLFLTIMYIFDRNKAYIRWLCSVPATIVALTMVLIQVLIMGLFPQELNSGTSNLYSVKQSLPFFVSILFLQTCLTVVIFNRCFPLRKSNLQFLLNHFGLWLIISGIAMGSGDLQRFSVRLKEGGSRNLGEFTLHLDRFFVKNYLPKGVFVNLEEGKLIEKTIEELRPSSKINYLNYEIEVLDYVENAEFNGGNYIPSSGTGTAPAVLLKIKDQQEQTAWISCGSELMLPKRVDFNSQLGFVMLKPEPERFESHLEIETSDGIEHRIIAVNEPFTLGNWKIYQQAYEMEGDDKYSVLEMIYDPWLPIVYIGIIMLILGSFGLILKRKQKSAH